MRSTRTNDRTGGKAVRLSGLALRLPSGARSSKSVSRYDALPSRRPTQPSALDDQVVNAV
jgi:hypothetical protein